MWRGAVMSIWSLRDTRTGLSQGIWIHLRAVLLYYNSTSMIMCEHVNALHHRYGLDQLYIVTVNPGHIEPQTFCGLIDSYGVIAKHWYH